MIPGLAKVRANFPFCCGRWSLRTTSQDSRRKISHNSPCRRLWPLPPSQWRFRAANFCFGWHAHVSLYTGPSHSLRRWRMLVLHMPQKGLMRYCHFLSRVVSIRQFKWRPPKHPSVLCVISEVSRIFLYEDPQYIPTLNALPVANLSFHLTEPAMFFAAWSPARLQKHGAAFSNLPLLSSKWFGARTVDAIRHTQYVHAAS